jgi:hypothetical protein
MTAVPITLTRRPRITGRPIAGRTSAPATLVLLDDVEAAATANTGRCNDDNPYR